MRTYPLVPQVGALGCNAPPPDLQLPSAGLKPLQLLPLCGVILCYVICTFKGVIVHHLILTLLKHMHMNRLTCTGIQGYTFLTTCTATSNRSGPLFCRLVDHQKY